MEVLALAPTGGSLPMRLPAAEPEAAASTTAEEVSPSFTSPSLHIPVGILTG